MRSSFKLLRGLLWTIWTIYVAAAVGLLGLRYLALPRIDQWRPQIEQYVSETVGAPVRIGRIAADWHGLNPRLELSSVEVAGTDGAPVLTLPSVEAVLGWRSILGLEPRLLLLQAHGPDLTLRRDAADRLWVAGRSIDLAQDDQHDLHRHPALRWLARQREIVLRHATIRWQDELRGAPELVLHDASFAMLNGSRSHRFALQARPPAALARGLVLRGEFNRRLFAIQPWDLAAWQGQLYAEVDDGEPAGWRAWLDMPALQGRIAARGWLQLDGRRLGTATMDVVGRGVGWQWRDGVQAMAGAVKARVQGDPGDLVQGEAFPVLARSGAGAGIAIAGHAQDVTAQLPGIFAQPQFSLDAVQLDATARRAANGVFGLDVRDLHVVNADLDAQLQGRWQAGGSTDAGTADLQGTLHRAAMPAVHRYLPLEVSESAREWLEQGLLEGDVHDARLELRGDLGDFPFSRPGQDGRFHIGGRFAGATLDYVPGTPGHKGWPPIHDLDGSFAIDGAALSLQGEPGGVLRVAGARTQPVRLRTIKAAIPDMERNAELYLQGETTAPVEAYLAMADASPLGAMLDNALQRAHGKGNWQMALALHVPLLHPDDTAVEGTLAFDDNEFTFFPELPALTQMRGLLEFSDTDVRVRDLQAQFLGGPLKITGSLLDRNGLRFEGRVTSNSLARFLRGPGMSRIAGHADVHGRLLYAPGQRVDLTLESDLAGMAIELPAPLGKSAGAALPMRVQWAPARDAGAAGRALLTANVDRRFNLLLEHDPAEKRWTFARGALATDRQAVLPERGMTIDLALPYLDVDAWQEAAASFDALQSDAPLPTRRGAVVPLLPPASRVAITASGLRVAGFRLNDLNLKAVQSMGSEWRLDIQSRQATGALSWHEASGAIAGQVTGRFKHLSFEGDTDENKADEDSSGDDLEDIPAVDIQADDLRVYGKDLGSLQIRGTNLERGVRWRLDKLRIANDNAALDASGFWRLSGPGRGLTVDAQAKWEDLGPLLARLGLPDTAAGGKGSATGQLTWKDLPWSHSLAGIRGKLTLRMDKGRFIHVNSRTARLLELLSMQSLQRLAKLELNPANAFREGFPFDTVHAHFDVADGVIHTDDYKVNGPVATIALAGSTSIIDETWDLKAVVVPNLDASGAAVLTAVAINPLLGLGAFLTQWVLKHPLARAMTMQYAVTGSWDDPKVAAIEGPLPGSENDGLTRMPSDPIEH